MRKVWKNGKSHGSTITNKPQPIQYPGLKAHFTKHFNPDHSNLQTPPEITDPPEFIKNLQQNDPAIDNSPPTSTEMFNAIKQLNKGKSSLDIETEIVQLPSSVPLVMTNLEKYYKTIWQTKEILDKWTISRITPIWKRKGSTMDP